MKEATKRKKGKEQEEKETRCASRNGKDVISGSCDAARVAGTQNNQKCTFAYLLQRYSDQGDPTITVDRSIFLVVNDRERGKDARIAKDRRIGTRRAAPRIR